MTTNNHPAHGHVSLDRLYQIREHLQHDIQYQNGGNRAYILADMLKVIDGAIVARVAEPVAVINGAREPVLYGEHIGIAIGTHLYTAPPVPVAMKDHQIRELVNELRDIAIEYHGTQQLRERIARTVRAAMLQAGNSAVTPDGWIPVSERMPEESGRYWCYVEEQNSLGKSHYQWNCSWNGEVWSEKALTGRVTHWMPLPAAPKQEVM